MKMRHLISAITLSIGLLNASTVNAQPPITTPLNNPLNNPLVLINQPAAKTFFAASLLIINSHAATLTNQKKKSATLTLQDVDPYVIQFTAGPDRKATLMTTDEWLHSWNKKNNTHISPPSAALAGVCTTSSQNQPHYILELSNPVYDAKHGTLSFKVKFTSGSALPQSNTTFTSVSLVIDDGLQVALNEKYNLMSATMLASAKK